MQLSITGIMIMEKMIFNETFYGDIDIPVFQ